MGAGAFAREADAARVDAVARAVGVKPRECIARVVDLRGPASGAHEAILDAGDGEAFAGEIAHEEGPAFVAVFPAAAVEPHDERRGARLRWDVAI